MKSSADCALCFQLCWADVVVAGIGEPVPVGERHLDLFQITSHRGQVEFHQLGQRIPYHGAERARGG